MTETTIHDGGCLGGVVRYRQILESDVPAISGVHRRACLIAYEFMDWSYSEEEVRQWHAGKFSNWDWGLVAEDAGVIGYAVANGTHLDQLFVDPARQGTGIGTSLLTSALSKDRPVATLTVFEENAPARRLYERHGFRLTRRYFNEQDQAVELAYGRFDTSGIAD